MSLSSPSIFNETKACAWQFAATLALTLAVVALFRVSPEFSLLNLGISLAAGLTSFVMSNVSSDRVPRGILTLWAVVLVGFWLSPLAALSPDVKRLIFAGTVVYLSLVFQGAVGLFFGILLFGLAVCLHDFSADGLRHQIDLRFIVGLAMGTTLLFTRVAHARSRDLLRSLKLAGLETEKTSRRLCAIQENIQFTREKMLGRTRVKGESLPGDAVIEKEATGVDSSSVAFDDVIACLRKTFSDYQLKGRQEGRISGPVRFVFFAPVAGYDGRSLIAVDLSVLQNGVEASLALALESLPEVGARRREGVIRLSIRYGLRAVEVTIEDNGRGLASRNSEAEDGVAAFKVQAENWGGKFGRLARLGVGSRASLELRIVRERARVVRSSIRHHQLPMSIESIFNGASSMAQSEGAPRA